MTAPYLAEVEAAIARVLALPDDHRRAIFTEFTPKRIRAEAERQQARHDRGEDLPLFGLRVSVKDLFDEAGQTTGAGSRLLADGPPAATDAPVVARLRQAGALMFGRSSMSEFAYSGVGLNPHHGTPSSALVPGVIPGGSSSGGAVGLALGLTQAAIGTDTGGSLRIPAVANGIWGIKPSQGLIPAQGVHPLAPSYDVPGPMAADHPTLCRMMAVMAGMAAAPVPQGPLSLAVPEAAFTDGLSPELADWFAAETRRLEGLGHRLEPVDLAEIGASVGLNRIIVSVEAHRLYAPHLKRLETVGDPRVLARIRFAETLSQAQIDEAYAARAALAHRFGALMAGFDAMVAPALPMLPPTIAEVEADFDRLNAAMLRNPSLVNLVDGCAMVQPSSCGGRPWSLSMLVGAKGTDARLLAIAALLAPTAA